MRTQKLEKKKEEERRGIVYTSTHAQRLDAFWAVRVVCCSFVGGGSGGGGGSGIGKGGSWSGEKARGRKQLLKCAANGNSCRQRKEKTSKQLDPKQGEIRT